MSTIPAELQYTASHEWIRKEDDGSYVIGMTEHAQELLGEMIFIDLPDVGDEVNAGDDIAVIETVKSASDLYSPLSGEIIAVNEELDDSPEIVNADAYGDGWLFRIMPTDLAELDDLLDADGYLEVVNEE